MYQMKQFERHLHVLQSCPLFSGLSAQGIGALLVPPAHTVRFARDACLFAPGDTEKKLAILLEGSALVYKGDRHEKRLLMSRLKAGDILGMATLFGRDAAFPSDVIAERPSLALFLPKVWVLDAFSREPRLSTNYIALLSDRIGFLSRRIDILSVHDLPGRLYRVLCSFVDAQAPHEPFSLPFSFTQLAQMLGVGRASLYRALDSLVQDGYITRHAREITLLSREDSLP